MLFVDLYGWFYDLEGLSVGVLTTRELLFGVYAKAPVFWKLPCRFRIPGLPKYVK